MIRGPEESSWLVPAETAAQTCADFIRRTIDAAGAEGVVIGLSGGIDSAVSAALAVRALGADRVSAVCLPYRASRPESLADALAVAAALDLRTETIDITPMADPWLADIPGEARVRRGNIMARCRMIALYDRSARLGRLVLGTGNRTETLLGYATVHGDAAFALNPLEYLYKAEIKALAQHLDLPAAVIDKAPSADLWEGQTDEGELGFTYAEADRLLHYMIDEGLGRGQLVSLGFEGELVDRVADIVRRQAFKWLPVPSPVFPGRPYPDHGGRNLPNG